MRASIRWIDGVQPGRLAFMPRPAGGEWLSEDLTLWRKAGVDVVASLLTRDEERRLGLDDEERLCAEQRLRFCQFAIPDHTAPESMEAVHLFVQKLAASVQAGESVVVHCFAGIGRSATVAGCVLVRLGFGIEDLLDRMAAARGMVVPETEEQEAFLRRYAETYAP